MSEPPTEFYSAERWYNWVDRADESEIDPEEQDSARLLLNMQDDTALAVAKIIEAHEDDVIDAETAREKIDDVRDIVMAEVDIGDEEARMLVEGVQTSLMCVFHSAEEFIVGGGAEEATVEEYLRAAADAEAEEDFDAALVYSAKAGTRVIASATGDAEDDLDVSLTEDIEYGYVTEWINGLDSLADAMRNPEVVEEDDIED
jgi:hypothetical protein